MPNQFVDQCGRFKTDRQARNASLVDPRIQGASASARASSRANTGRWMLIVCEYGVPDGRVAYMPGLAQ